MKRRREHQRTVVRGQKTIQRKRRCQKPAVQQTTQERGYYDYHLKMQV